MKEDTVKITLSLVMMTFLITIPLGFMARNPESNGLLEQISGYKFEWVLGSAVFLASLTVFMKTLIGITLGGFSYKID